MQRILMEAGILEAIFSDSYSLVITNRLDFKTQNFKTEPETLRNHASITNRPQQNSAKVISYNHLLG